MKKFVVACLVLSTCSAWAASSGRGKHWMVGGYYGMGFINPKDINTPSVSTTPRLGNLSGSTLYGGNLGYMLSSAVQVRVGYEMQNAKNPTRVTSPFSSTSAGFELQQNEIWAGFNVFPVHKDKFYIYLGASAGYPVYSHVTSTLSTKTEYDADKTVGFMGQGGLGVIIGSFLSLYVEGGYQSLISGDVKSGATTLTTSSGTKAKVDLSGGRALAGLAFIF